MRTGLIPEVSNTSVTVGVTMNRYHGNTPAAAGLLLSKMRISLHMLKESYLA